ncbi:DUF7344 domain-containing protein [Haloprofundus salilacus]|uniref:DUF7344 domain-containing protein n=1 Tax=Haloprofundus salilacus TaxID=2876190 RepID=UPI001CCABACE|nr:hypothetical protein [Haloprofundus salilacus]
MSSDTPQRSLAPSKAFQLLADPCRRAALYVLFDTNEPLGYEQLVDRMLRRETTPFRDRHRLALELHHTVLPKLTESTFVRYDEQTRRLRFCDPDSELEPYLTFAQSMDSERDR